MNVKMLRRIAGLMIVGSLLAGIFGCTSKADITGKWKGKMTLENADKPLSNLEFDLIQKSGDISGKMIFTKIEGGKVTLHGVRTGDELKFSTERKPGLIVHFTGDVESGSRIIGTALLVYSDPKVPVSQDKVTLELTR